MTTSTLQLALYSLLLAVPVVYIARRTFTSATPKAMASANEKKDEEPKTLMQPPREDLQLPKDDPITLEQLKEFDGSDPSKPIYVSIKGTTLLTVVYPWRPADGHAGTVFDVSRKLEVYGPGKSYNLFAGKDGSKGLGMSSLKPEHAVSDYSELDAKDAKVLDDWHDFFACVPLSPLCLVSGLTCTPLPAGSDIILSAGSRIFLRLRTPQRRLTCNRIASIRTCLYGTSAYQYSPFRPSAWPSMVQRTCPCRHEDL